jgi:hypothetical protein
LALPGELLYREAYAEDDMTSEYMEEEELSVEELSVDELRAELQYKEACAEDDMTSENVEELSVEELRAELQYREAYASLYPGKDEMAFEEEEREESFCTSGKTSGEESLVCILYVCIYIHTFTCI